MRNKLIIFARGAGRWAEVAEKKQREGSSLFKVMRPRRRTGANRIFLDSLARLRVQHPRFFVTQPSVRTSTIARGPHSVSRLILSTITLPLQFLNRRSSEEVHAWIHSAVQELRKTSLIEARTSHADVSIGANVVLFNSGESRFMDPPTILYHEWKRSLRCSG